MRIGSLIGTDFRDLRVPIPAWAASEHRAIEIQAHGGFPCRGRAADLRMRGRSRAGFPPSPACPLWRGRVHAPAERTSSPLDWAMPRAARAVAVTQPSTRWPEGA